MKKYFVLLILLSAAVLPARAATISLVAPSPVAVGSNFDVLVQATDVFAGRGADDLVLAYGFNVTIANGALFGFLGETPGALFDDVSGFFGGDPMVAGLATSLAGIAPGDFSGPLTLATLHFQALQAGSTSIGVTWDSSDLNQGLIFADLPYGAIDASSSFAAVAVPEPGSLLALGVFVFATGIVRRRRFGKN